MTKSDQITNISKEQNKIKSVRSEKFREITQDRIMGGIREGYFFYIIQSEQFKNDENAEPELVDEVLVRISPQQALKTYEWLGRLIKQYEKVFGEIRTVEQIVTANPDLLKKS